jgi:adenylate cyclase, class 2
VHCQLPAAYCLLPTAYCLLPTASYDYRRVSTTKRVLQRVFEELGLQVWFRYQKYREEYSHQDVIVAIDETPVGVFVELEGTEQGIVEMTAALGRTPSDYILQSYYSLFTQQRARLGMACTDMLFLDE